VTAGSARSGGWPAGGLGFLPAGLAARVRVGPGDPGFRAQLWVEDHLTRIPDAAWPALLLALAVLRAGRARRRGKPPGTATPTVV
jgi:hypothetical protein